MSLSAKLAARAAQGKPIRVGLIGAGKFGSMFLSQVPTIHGLEVVFIADRDVERARTACRTVGWDSQRISRTSITSDVLNACARDDVEVVVEATGNPGAGIAHASAAIDAGKHVVMVSVEADVLAGPLLAARARDKGVVYSMAYGDQPALIAEMVDWARSCGFIVAAAGKGTKYLPSYHSLTPAEIWSHYGLTAAQASLAGMNPQMFNSFLDGTKTSIEMAAVANACALDVPFDGLSFPPSGVDDLAHVLRPKANGGLLDREGMVAVVSSLERDGRPVFRDLRWGVFVLLKAPNKYAAACFSQYGLQVDSTGLYGAMYKPFHLIGLELSVSVLNAVLRGEATGTPMEWRADVVAVAKRNLKSGDVLDGEGGYTVYGKLVPASRSLAEDLLPIGLAHGVKVKRDLPAGSFVKTSDVLLKDDDLALKTRREMERMSRTAAAA
jgi:predicted homoserine dehydrogenase-like protein